MQAWKDLPASDGIATGIKPFAKAYEDGGVEPREYMGLSLKSKK